MSKTEKHPDVSVIIVSYNTETLLDACLKSLFHSLISSRISHEVIVIDNASDDGTVAMLDKKYPRVKIIRNIKNSGFGSANNAGIKQAVGKYVLLLNSDTLVQEQSIDSLYRFCQLHPLSFVGPKLLNPDGTNQASSGPFYTLPVVFMMLFFKGDLLGITRYSPDRPRNTDWVSGACFMGEKSLFTDYDLMFDEKIFLYMEELDLFYRARQKGIRVWFTPASRITHYGTGSATDGKRTAVKNIFIGLRYFYRKHYGSTRYGILIIMLTLKAALGIGIGIMTGNKSLKNTYEEAIRMV